MVFAEITQFRESPRGLEERIAQIGFCWQNIPEFKVGTEKLKNLVIICDGNRRAAAERGLNPYFGHRVGIEVIRGIARACRQWEIKTLTFWTWSTENWEREGEQVKFVMGLAEKFLPDRELFEKGEFPHTSGFMPLQTTYAGWEFLPVLFPDLTPQSLLEPIQNFINYERRLGK